MLKFNIAILLKSINIKVCKSVEKMESLKIVQRLNFYHLEMIQNKSTSNKQDNLKLEQVNWYPHKSVGCSVEFTSKSWLGN